MTKELAPTTTTAEEQFKKLGEPFKFDEIELKPQSVNLDANNGGPSALCVPYIQASAARARLNAIFKPWNWRVEYREILSKGGMICRLTVITADGKEVVREGMAGFTDIEAIKGGESDSFKRAFAALGNDTLKEAELGWFPIETRPGKGGAQQFKRWKNLSEVQRKYHQSMQSLSAPAVQEKAPKASAPEMGVTDPFEGKAQGAKTATVKDGKVTEWNGMQSKPGHEPEVAHKPLNGNELGAWAKTQKWTPDQWVAYKKLPKSADRASAEKETNWEITLNSAIAGGCKTYDECVKHLEEN